MYNNSKNQKKNVLVIFLIISASIMLTTISSKPLIAAFGSSSDVGFQDGCSDAQTGTSNAINGHSNAGHHSSAYMQAYNRGLASCGNSGSSNSNSGNDNQPTNPIGKLACKVGSSLGTLGAIASAVLC